MFHPLLKRPYACVLCAALASGSIGSALADAPVLGTGIDKQNFDPAVRVQDDFFRHVNGHWLQTTPIPADKAAIGAFDQLRDDTQEQTRLIIERAVAKPSTPDARKIGVLYADFMDEAALDKLGVEPLSRELAAIDAVHDAHQFALLLPRLERLGVSLPVGAIIGQDDRDSTRYVPTLHQSGLGLPDRDYYLKQDDARFKDVREKYVAHLARLLALAGEKDTDATARAVMALETELARAQWPRVELRDPVKNYHLTDLADLPKLAPGFDWAAYAQAAGYTGKIGNVIVGQPSYFKGFAQLVQSTPIATWQAYARVRLLSAYAPYLSKAFVDERFGFVGTVLRGTPQNLPRWRRGVALVNESIGQALGKLYVAEYFPPEQKARMEKLVANLLEAYRRSIDTLDWMGPATKKAAQAKLALFSPKIGYPSKWRDYSSLDIRAGDLVGNVMRARRFEYDRNLAKLGAPIDRTEWFMTPQTVNAYYNPSMNEIVFPASILQPPFFDPKADDAVNYGAIGAVIGHEISHGFDDQGSQYDGRGNLRDWWTEEDRARFKAKTDALVAQYDAFEPVKGYHVNGELTLGENIADNSGLEIAYKAYQLSLHGEPAPVIGGMTGDERFFYGFAQVWRGKARDAALIERIKSDPHAPNEFRANGTVRNHPAYYSTFGVKAGDDMYLAPDKRVSIW